MRPVIACGVLQSANGTQVSLFLVYYLHSLQCLVEPVDQTICLWMLDRRPDWLNLQQLTETRQLLGNKGRTFAS